MEKHREMEYGMSLKKPLLLKDFARCNNFGNKILRALSREHMNVVTIVLFL
jgi:hypothetical protein